MANLISIKEQIVSNFGPEMILLFGSQAKGTATPRSDVDICVVANTPNKRMLLTEMYYQVLSDTPIDFLLYTPEEWEKYSVKPQSFAYKLKMEGICLYAR